MQIAKVLFNGQDVTAQMVNGTYQTPGVTEASSFEVQVNVVGDIHVKELRMLDDEVAVKQGETVAIDPPINELSAAAPSSSVSFAASGK